MAGIHMSLFSITLGCLLGGFLAYPFGRLNGGPWWFPIAVICPLFGAFAFAVSLADPGNVWLRESFVVMGVGWTVGWELGLWMHRRRGPKLVSLYLLAYCYVRHHRAGRPSKLLDEANVGAPPTRPGGIGSASSEGEQASQPVAPAQGGPLAARPTLVQPPAPGGEQREG